MFCYSHLMYTSLNYLPQLAIWRKPAFVTIFWISITDFFFLTFSELICFIYFYNYIIVVSGFEAWWQKHSGDRIKQDGIFGSLGAVSFILLVQATNWSFCKRFSAMFLLLLKLHLKKQVLPIARPESRAEKRKWLRHCPAASNLGSSAPSFKVIGEKTTCA